MNSLPDFVRRVVAILDELSAPWMFVGSMASTLFNDDASLDELTASDLAGEYPAIQYVTPDGACSIDILARLGDAFAFEDLEATETTWRGVPMTVVTPRQLFLMKRDTVRPQDRADALRLQARFGLGEG
jgi:hypothetical protein